MTSTLAQGEKSVISANEDDILRFAEKIKRNANEDRIFSGKIDDFLNGRLPPQEVVKIGTTPYCLRALNVEAIPLVVTQGVLANSIESSQKLSNRMNRKHTEQHNIPRETIKLLPQALRNPILICKGNTKDSLVVISELKDKQRDNIIVPIMLNVKGQHGRVNKVSTIHGKKNIENYLDKLTKNNSVLAMNKEKADKLYLDTGVQSPQSTTIICFDNSISYSLKNVKSLNEISMEKFSARPRETVENSDKPPGTERRKLSLSEQIDKARAENPRTDSPKQDKQQTKKQEQDL